MKKNHVELDSKEFFDACSKATNNFKKQLFESGKEKGKEFSELGWLSEFLTCQIFSLELSKILFNDDDEIDNNVTFEEVVNIAND